MLSDMDRIKGENMESYIHPVGYVLKGPSLPVSKMHNIINHLQNDLKHSGVDVICETSDGQWANMCFENADGFPLTLLHLQKKSWNAVNNLSVIYQVIQKMICCTSFKCKTQTTGLLNSDINILATLPDDLIEDLATDMGNAEPCDWNLNDALTSDKFNILEDICNILL